MTHPTAPWEKHEGLVGRTIVAVDVTNDDEVAALGVVAIVLELDDGSRWWLSSDSEGNRGGDIHRIEECSTPIPLTQREIKTISESLQSTLQAAIEYIYDEESKEAAISLYDTDPNVSALKKTDPEAATKVRELIVAYLERLFDRGGGPRGFTTL